jgi:hypothetical protein
MPSDVRTPHSTAAEGVGELERLGFDPAICPAAAAHALHRICDHHGWPKEAIQVASSGGDEAVDLGGGTVRAGLLTCPGVAASYAPGRRFAPIEGA